MQEQYTPSQRSDAILPMHTLPPLDEYIATFTSKYRSEKAFRTIVHQYMDLGKVDRFTLSLTSKLLPSYHKKKTTALIEEYATSVRDDLIAAMDIKNELAALERAKNDLHGTAEDIIGKESEQGNMAGHMEQAAIQQEEALRRIEQEHEERKRAEEEKAHIEMEKIQQSLDANTIAREQVRKQLQASTLLVADANGVFRFDENILIEKLEDIFLQEILNDMGNKEGIIDFAGKLKEDYKGLIAYWNHIERLDELTNVDWVKSTIYSRTKGYKHATYPYLVTAKHRWKEKTTLDTAICIDVSRSMENNNRMDAARKMGLATNSLMRKLNPENNTYLSVYSDNVKEITPLELLKEVKPWNWTRTHLALDWLYEKLEGKGPSLAYLVTDGHPAYDPRLEKQLGEKEAIESSVDAARKFAKDPYVKLSIFLIDGDEFTENVIRRIGKAAGNDTSVIPVKSSDLGGRVIKDIARSIRGMKTIGSF